MRNPSTEPVVDLSNNNDDLSGVQIIPGPTWSGAGRANGSVFAASLPLVSEHDYSFEHEMRMTTRYHEHRMHGLHSRQIAHASAPVSPATSHQHASGAVHSASVPAVDDTDTNSDADVSEMSSDIASQNVGHVDGASNGLHAAYPVPSHGRSSSVPLAVDETKSSVSEARRREVIQRFRLDSPLSPMRLPREARVRRRKERLARVAKLFFDIYHKHVNDIDKLLKEKEKEKDKPASAQDNKSSRYSFLSGWIPGLS